MPLSESLEKFFRAEANPWAVALFRIALGLTAIVAGLRTHRDVRNFLAVDFIRWRPAPWIPDLSPEYLPLYIALFLGSAALFTLGWRTRAAGCVLFGCLSYRYLLDASLETSSLNLLSFLLLPLVLGNAGARYSVDAWLRAGNSGRCAYWAAILVQAQVTIVYLYAGAAKINPQFLTGEHMQRSISVLRWISSPEFFVVFSYFVIAFELSLGIALWVPALKPWAFLLGTAFHFGNLVWLGFYALLIVFAVEFVATYLLFLDTPERSRTLSYGPGETEYRLVAWLRRLDWLQVHRWEPGGTGLTLRRTDGSEVRNAAAVGEALAVCPLTFLLGPLLRWNWLQRGMWRWAGFAQAPAEGVQASS